MCMFFFFSSRRRHTRWNCDWSSDVCSSDLCGLIGGAISLFVLGSINLQVGYWDIFWPQFFQGLSMGLIFVPLTTVTMSLIKKEEMGNATSLFNLMRNLGGSVGIAVIATTLSRNTQ